MVADPYAHARRGVAVGPKDVYAVSNWSLTRYDKATGEKKAEWSGDPKRFPHLNSCTLIAADLVCAASNFPGTPHVSTVEVFDPHQPPSTGVPGQQPTRQGGAQVAEVQVRGGAGGVPVDVAHGTMLPAPRRVAAHRDRAR